MNNPAEPFNPPPTNFRERRDTTERAVPPGVERRQFSNSYQELSPPAKELAMAVDEYKIRHHRRFVTFEEILQIVRSLGYSKVNNNANI